MNFFDCLNFRKGSVLECTCKLDTQKNYFEELMIWKIIYFNEKQLDCKVAEPLF